jgi:hypothetical protein
VRLDVGGRTTRPLGWFVEWLFASDVVIVVVALFAFEELCINIGCEN